MTPPEKQIPESPPILTGILAPPANRAALASTLVLAARVVSFHEVSTPLTTRLGPIWSKHVLPGEKDEVASLALIVGDSRVTRVISHAAAPRVVASKKVRNPVDGLDSLNMSGMRGTHRANVVGPQWL